MLFEWDEKKENANRQKHGVSFEEVARIFHRPSLTYFDGGNEDGEDRGHWMVRHEIADGCFC